MTWWRYQLDIRLAIHRSWVSVLVGNHYKLLVDLYASITKQYNLVPAKGGDALQLGK